MRVLLPNICHDEAGFQALVRLFAESQACAFDTIEIDLAHTGWFDADMCAAFGAVLYRLSDRMNTVNLSNIQPNVGKILAKNGFLSHYGREQIPDTWGTTIGFRRFDVKDDRYFASYIEDEFILRSEMPTMSGGLLKKFRESIFEIFSNAVLHSRTELGIFSCGQYFPKRDRLDFSVADLGIGMCANIRESLGLELTPDEAIVWATQGRNTTKRGPVPGGLGLKLLSEFIDRNGGSIQIVSDGGYWQQAHGKARTARLDHPFPGTVVTLEINTADTQSHSLHSELDRDNIF